MRQTANNKRLIRIHIIEKEINRVKDDMSGNSEIWTTITRETRSR